jgi:hypothetical protein
MLNSQVIVNLKEEPENEKSMDEEEERFIEEIKEKYAIKTDLEDIPYE